MSQAVWHRTWLILTKATLSGSQEHLLKMQKQKLQLPQQAPPPQAPPGPPPPSAQVPVQPPPPAPQQSPQLTTVTASRPGALLTGTTVANLQVARLVSPPRYVVFRSTILLSFNLTV